MSAFNRLCDRLAEVTGATPRVNGCNKARARCPVRQHGNPNPSLVVTSIEGQALLYCHAGCSTEDVINALNLTMADLFDDPRGASYRYESGRVVHRTPDKKFHQSGDLSKVELYHPDRLPAATEGSIFLVEGEKDVLAIESAGGVATTAPQGAANFAKVDVSPLADRHVTAIVDRDEAGQRWASEVAKTLNGVVAKLRFMQAKVGKDAADHIAAGHGLGDFEPVEVEQVAQIEDAHRVGRQIRLTPASKFAPRRVHWGWNKRFPIGELILIPGREGAGKSLLLAWLAAQITRGTLPGEFSGTPRAVLYAASEDSWHHTLTPRLLAAGADLNLVYRVEVEATDLMTGETRAARVTLPSDCRAIASAAVEVNAAALMLDPAVSLVDERLSINQSHELRRALEPLRDAAEHAEIMVPALVHFNKTADVDVLTKIPGARAWAEVARAAFAVAADTEAGCFVASQVKNNLGRLDLPNLTYVIEEVFIETDDGQASVGLLKWTGETDTSASDVLDRSRRTSRRTSDLTAEIVAFVISHGHTIAVGEVAAGFPGVARDTVQKVLKRAAQRGELSNPMHGHYGPP